MTVLPDAEELVGEALTDLFHAAKVNLDLGETLELGGEAFRLGPRDEVRTLFEQGHLHRRPVGSRSVRRREGVEDIELRCRGVAVDLASYERPVKEFTDEPHDPMIPHTFVLEPGLKIFKIYNGYWY